MVSLVAQLLGITEETGWKSSLGPGDKWAGILKEVNQLAVGTRLVLTGMLPLVYHMKGDLQ